MGRPFEKELAMTSETVSWAFSESINPSLKNIASTSMPHPLLVVGSGGSLSGAYFVAQIHEQITGKMAKAITPLELIFSQINPALHGVLFLTAGGNNKDIINAFEKAVQSEFATIGVVCAKVDSEISRRAKLYSHIQLFEYRNPGGKDGFLAVNSLLSTCILTARAYGALDFSKHSPEKLFELETNFNSYDWNSILQRKSIIALGAGWAWPALVDLESKFTEAALGNVIISDFRNFAHGRHNWFNKKGDESALLVLETVPMGKMAQKTMNLLPAKYPRAVLASSLPGPLSCLHLYIQIFHLVNEAGKRLNIDPGKPEIPEFGRKIYHIGISTAISTKNKGNRLIWIKRKIRVSNESEDIVEYALDEFLANLKSTRFSGIVFDYDGTLCDLSERFQPPRQEIALALNNLLSEGIPVGIATGRGRSVQESLKQVIDQEYWGKIFIGNYNGAVILTLNDELPKVDEITSGILRKADILLKNDPLLRKYTKIETRAKQISISFSSWAHKQSALKRISEILNELKSLKIVQSEHSIDILAPDVSKLSVVEALKASIEGKEKNVLIIGDQGQFGGNDFEMLSLLYSLSVNKVSTSLKTCWNLAAPGLRGSMAVLFLIKAIKIKDKTFQLEIDLLDKEVVK